jgi:hypothetical protein
MEIIDPIPFELDIDDLLETLGNRRIREKDVLPLIDECRQLIEPKAVYKFVQVTQINNSDIQVDNRYHIQSIILGDSLVNDQEIVPYVVTIGSQLEANASKESKSNILKAFIMEQIADYSLVKARLHIRSLFTEKLGNNIFNFSPGTGTGKLFDINQQEVLFKIIDPAKIGVRLTPTYLMLPKKSISGFFAATSNEYEACEYCPRKCEHRRKAYSGEYIGHQCEEDVY